MLRALRDDRDAEEWIAERACTVGLRLATFSLGDRTLAQDVAQEVAIRVLAGLPKLRDAERFDAWTYRICAREIKRAARKRRRLETHEDTVVTADVEVGAGFVEQLGQRDWLTRALAELSDRQRLVLGLRYVYDLDDAEIAAAIGARRGTVRSLASRAITRLGERAEREANSAMAEEEDSDNSRMETIG